jgi:starch-binding outer membrane protein, SusD/RagB family
LAQNDALYKEIITEKYISLLGHLEVFNDMRRSGYGSFAAMQNWQVVGVTPNVGTTIPQRFLIAQVEINSNSNAAGSLKGLFDKTAVFQ